MSNVEPLLAKRAARPLATIVIEPVHWKADSPLRRDKPEMFGLRLLSEYDKSEVKMSAITFAKLNWPDDREEQTRGFNDRLMACYVSRALCNPNDASKGMFEFPDEQGPRALVTEFFRDAWFRLEVLSVQVSPTIEMLSDADLDDFKANLTAERLNTILPLPRQRRLRRMLAYIRSELKR